MCNLCFCTKHGANRVARKLENAGIVAEAIHGNKSQNARQRALQNFKDGDAWVLVATDIAARGIDIDSVSHVINYELPHEPESYVHRIGRTGRAGATGIAYSLVDPSERGRLRAVERLIKQSPVEVTVEVAPRDPLEVLAYETRRKNHRASSRDGSSHQAPGTTCQAKWSRWVGLTLETNSSIWDRSRRSTRCHSAPAGTSAKGRDETA